MVKLPAGYANVEAYAQDLLAFLHRPLSKQITGGIHVNDAFVLDAWDHLPTEWTQWWEGIDDYREAQKDLINTLRSTSHLSTAVLADRPASLTQWLDQIRFLGLDRDQVQVCKNMDPVVIPEGLRSRMITKKFEEVQVAATYIRDFCTRNGINRVIDIGSGQGYLSLLLAATCNVKVLAIDGSSKQIEGSKCAARSIGLVEGVDITHMVRFIDGVGVRDDLLAWSQNEPCILVGLHACGSLTEHMVRLCATTICIAGLAVVGCCYNHIRPLSASQPDGFPISQYMRTHGLKLSTSALITGCQAPTNWLHHPNSTFSHKYFYRAVLEKLLHDKGLGDPDHRAVWGIRTGDLKNFESYATRAINRLGLTFGVDVTDDEIVKYENTYRGSEGVTAILWTLSVLLCQVVESAIALDRYFFLLEHGIRHVDILPIFDYKTSPRNLMIVARKDTRDA